MIRRAASQADTGSGATEAASRRAADRLVCTDGTPWPPPPGADLSNVRPATVPGALACIDCGQATQLADGEHRQVAAITSPNPEPIRSQRLKDHE